MDKGGKYDKGGKSEKVIKVTKVAKMTSVDLLGENKGGLGGGSGGGATWPHLYARSQRQTERWYLP